MKAVIMAGGFGTRLRPLTCNIPKPMVPMVNKPIMEHIVRLLAKHGVKQIVTTLFYQPDVIREYFGDGSKFGVHIQYRKAEADLGTAGSVKNAKDLLDERTLIISGDVLTDFDLTQAVEFHRKKRAKATILLTRSANPLQFGLVMTDDEGRITRFVEKPSWGEVFSDSINTGIYILEPEILDLIPSGEEFDFSKNLFPLMLDQDIPLFGHISSGYWRDIGNLSEYQESHLDVLRNQVKLSIDGERVGNAIIDTNVKLETSPRNITGMVVVGKNSRIHRDVVISNSVVGADCEILPGAVIRNSIIWDGTQIGSKAELNSDVVGTKCIIGDEAILSENVFVSDRCVIGRKSQLYANIKLWPEKVVEEGASVNKSLVWEDRWLRELFTDARVTGISNIEMSPEFGARLGAAFGALVGSGSTVVTSRDSDNVSRIINRAVMCGLMSAGVNCNDLRATSIPIVRHELQSGKERGGIHVRKSPFDKNLTDIIFFDADGKDLPASKTKAVERLFFAEDFIRANYDKVGTLNFPERTTESYMERFLATINVQAIRSADLKIVVDYSNGVASTIFPIILGNLNVQVVSLHAYLDSRRLTRTKEEFDRSIQELGHVVTSLQYDLGVMLDAGAEKIFVVDEHGCQIDNDRMLTLMTKLVLLANKNIKTIAVPISASGEIDLIAREHKVKVVRTRESHLSLMDAATNKEIGFVGGTKGGFIFNEFLFASDGMYSLAKVLESIAISGTRIGELDKSTVRLHFVKKNVPCSWHVKGRVMRRLMKDTESYRRDLIEGVKIYPKNGNAMTSVFLNPDRARPIFHINAESDDPVLAEALAQEYAQKIQSWISTD
ncbi:MAG TPA: sugar phosphate nucleotidyltransferase [Bacteroidota bacterium]|nr:sugar phosphate nucleotidyltransferase [Bacteroidota bacterium]